MPLKYLIKSIQGERIKDLKLTSQIKSLLRKQVGGLNPIFTQHPAGE